MMRNPGGWAIFVGFGAVLISGLGFWWSLALLAAVGLVWMAVRAEDGDQ